MSVVHVGIIILACEREKGPRRTTQICCSTDTAQKANSKQAKRHRNLYEITSITCRDEIPFFVCMYNVYVYIYIYIYTHTHMYTRIYIHTHTYICMYTHPYTCIHEYTYTETIVWRYL